MSKRDLDIQRMVTYIRRGCLFEYIGNLDYGFPGQLRSERVPHKLYRVRNLPRMATTIFYVSSDIMISGGQTTNG